MIVGRLREHTQLVPMHPAYLKCGTIRCNVAIFEVYNNHNVRQCLVLLR